MHRLCFPIGPWRLTLFLHLRRRPQGPRVEAEHFEQSLAERLTEKLLRFFLELKNTEFAWRFLAAPGG